MRLDRYIAMTAVDLGADQPASRNSDDACRLLRDEYTSQVTAHAGYVLAVVVGIAATVPSWLQTLVELAGQPQGSSLAVSLLMENAVLTSALLVLLLFGIYVFFRLLYYSELTSVTSDILGINGLRVRGRFDTTIRFVRNEAPYAGMTSVVYTELEIRIAPDSHDIISSNSKRRMIRLVYHEPGPSYVPDTTDKIRVLLNDSLKEFIRERDRVRAAVGHQDS